MPVRIIQEDERYKTEYEGSIFYYRRLSARKSADLIKQYTKKGQLDYAAMGMAVVKYCLLDWEDVLDSKGEPIAYDPKLIDSMPDEVITELTGSFRDACPEDDKPSDEEQLGN
jgi:hypothetical protein